MEMFGYPEIRQELEDDKIHGLTNILTLGQDARHLFNAFRLWLEETVRFSEVSSCQALNCYDQDTPHSYQLCVSPGAGGPGQFTQADNHIVKFQVDGDTDLALNEVLPNPKYRRIHAAICKVARMSGAARAHALEHEESVFYRKLAERLKPAADSDIVP